MLEKSQAIVVQSTKYGDSGRILQLYTRENGLMPFIVQGLNSKYSSKKTHFQHLNIIEFSFYNSNKSKLRRLKDSKIIHDNSQLDIEKIYLLIFIAELVRNSIKEEEANQALFLFLKTQILALEMEQKSTVLFLLNFCLELSRYLGFYPSNNDSKYFNLIEGCFENSLNNTSFTLSEKNSQHLKDFMNGRQNFAMNEQKELLHSLLRFYSCHIQNFHAPKSLQMLDALEAE